MIVARVLVLLVLGGAITGFMPGGKPVQSCTTERLRECFDKFRVIFNDSILAFPVEPYQIKRSARFLEKARSCVQKWNERCFYSKIKLIKPNMIEGIIEVANTFGLTQYEDAYANYSVCFHKVATENCWDSYVQVRDFGNKIKNNVTLTFFTEFCCYHQAFAQCQENGILTTCKKGSFQMYPAHIEFLMQMILGSDCYSFDSPCTSNSDQMKEEGHKETIEWIPNEEINSAMESTLYLTYLLFMPTIMIIFI